MKIEMVLPSLAGAGMETMVARMTSKLAARGHQVGITCIIEKGVLAAALERQGIRVSHIAAPGVLANLWPRALARHIRELHPDVVHVHSGTWLKGTMAALQAHRPVTVLTAHGFVLGEMWLSRQLDRVAAHMADRVVAVTEAVRDQLVGQGCPTRSLAVIVNGIDTQLFAPRPASGVLRSKLRIEPGVTVLACVARLQAIKNHKLLLDGLARARAHGADCELVLFGDGDLRSALEQQAAALAIRDKVHFWGFEPAMQEFYSELDVFALTSTAEGTPISMLEAMASGVCCLATAVGGIVPLLDDGRSGVLVPSGDADALAAAIVELATDPGRRAALGRTARDRVMARFSEDTMIGQYEAIYADGRRT